MQYSKYVYSFPVDDNVIALYHALLIRTVFITNQETRQINLYFEKDATDDNTTIEAINYLYTNYFVVNNDEEDHALYSKCIDMISEPAISNAYIVVTENCNFNCKYCFISNAV